jgi:hypothetical protein
MVKISPSALGLLMKCPKCLWLYVNEGIKRPFGIFPSLPGGMDELFKNYFDIYRKKGELSPEINGKVKGKLYENFEKLNPWRDIDFGRGGLGAQFPDLDIKLRGAIDELLVNDKGEYVMFDFKTRGYPTKDDTHKHYQHQLDLYALLFKENGMKPAKYGYLLFFWPTEYKQNFTKWDTDLIEMEVSAKRGMKLLQEVREIADSEMPKAHKDCEYCMYRGVGLDFED